MTLLALRHLGPGLFAGGMVILSSLRIILDRDAKIVYDHPCLEEALEGILWRIRGPGLFCL
jgi:hypothetical protein